jgi:hypothetical protein
MMLRFTGWGLIAGLLVAGFAQTSLAAIAGLERVATRLFIGQRNGVIRVLNLATKTLEPTPFLSIPSVDQAGEGGLLGMAFHPNYPEDPRVFVNVTIDNGGLVFKNEVSPFSTHIRSYTVSANPNVANATPTPVLSFIQPQDNHNGGWIGFSPNNGYLYIPTGDGGGGNDVDHDGDNDGHTPIIGNAQDPTNLLGKILRIDVNGDDYPTDNNRNYAIPDGNPYKDGETPVVGEDEVWALGMRNPFRNSFDRLTGDLWMGDVGQGSREEVSLQRANATGGDNFGWKIREGLIGGTRPPRNVDPVYDYPRTGEFGGNTVIGGYVYRGPDPDLQGTYFFSDTSGKYWTFNTADVPAIPGNPKPTVTNIAASLTPDVGTYNFPVSYGEDAVGNLYIVFLGSGNVYRIRTNNLIDGDYNADGEVDEADYAVWNANFGATAGAGLAADGNGDNIVDAADFTIWRDNLGNSVRAIGAGGGSAVPEPTAIALVVAGVAMLPLRRNRR